MQVESTPDLQGRHWNPDYKPWYRLYRSLYRCFYMGRVLFVGVLIRRALLFGVYIRAPDSLIFGNHHVSIKCHLVYSRNHHIYTQIIPARRHSYTRTRPYYKPRLLHYCHSVKRSPVFRRPLRPQDPIQDYWGLLGPIGAY